MAELLAVRKRAVAILGENSPTVKWLDAQIKNASPGA